LLWDSKLHKSTSVLLDTSANIFDAFFACSWWPEIDGLLCPRSLSLAHDILAYRFAPLGCHAAICIVL